MGVCKMDDGLRFFDRPPKGSLRISGWAKNLKASPTTATCKVDDGPRSFVLRMTQDDSALPPNSVGLAAGICAA